MKTCQNSLLKENSNFEQNEINNLKANFDE